MANENDLRSQGAPPGSMRSGPKQSGQTQSADSGKNDKSLTPAELADAIANVRYFTTQHLEIIEAMATGIVLGAEQVQDKRLEIAELPPPSEGILENPIVAAGITIILEGTLGGAIAAVLVRQALAGPLHGISTGIGVAITQKHRLEEELKLFREKSADTARATRQKRRQKSFKEISRQLQEAESALRSDVAVKTWDIARAKKIGTALQAA